jgi:hypothetical protein
MVSWYVDEGLQRLDREWKAEHPGAVVYHIGDLNHSTDPDESQHAPDRGGSKPGDDKGEVDASDFMPGKGGVTEDDLDDLAENLRKSKDKRILIVIRRQRIFSSYPVGGVAPFTWRPYSGKYHGHTHVSVNDNYDNDQSDWKWENLVARTIQYAPIPGAKLPLLQLGDEDGAQDGWNHVARAQVLANWLDNKLPDLDTDGVYGANTARKFAKIFGGNGKKLELAHIKKLHGIS